MIITLFKSQAKSYGSTVILIIGRIKSSHMKLQWVKSNVCTVDERGKTGEPLEI